MEFQLRSAALPVCKPIQGLVGTSNGYHNDVTAGVRPRPLRCRGEHRNHIEAALNHMFGLLGHRKVSPILICSAG